MHKSFSYGNTFIITKEDLPIFCLNDRKLSSPFLWHMPHDARVPFLKGEYMKKRVLAIAAIVILAGLYVACLVLALIHSDAAFKLLQLTLVMTVLVPVTAYVAMMFYKLSHRDDEN